MVTLRYPKALACIAALGFAIILAATPTTGQAPSSSGAPGEFSPLVEVRGREVPFAFKRADRSRWKLDVLRLKTWMDLVDRHRPGEADEAARRLTQLPTWELAMALIDFQEVREIVVKATRLSHDDEHFALEILHMTPTELVQRDTAPVLRRAILAHTDVANANWMGRERPDGTSGAPLALHLGVALALVEDLAWESERRGYRRATAPTAPMDPAVAGWFLTTAAILQREREFTSAPLFGRLAVKCFPNNVDLLLLAGASHEFAASPRIQDSMVAQSENAVGKAVREQRPRDLEIAEACLARALDVAPSSVETRVHYGRVLGERGKRIEAIDVLRPATDAASPAPLRYLAWLFTGDNLAALGRATESDAAYRRASTLFPHAPSWHFALSAAARRRGDRQLAVEALGVRVDLALDESPDPWESYFETGRTRDADALLASLRRLLAERH